jgi:hypothetical protein
MSVGGLVLSSASQRPSLVLRGGSGPPCRAPDRAARPPPGASKHQITPGNTTVPELQNRWGAKLPGGFDSRPPPLSASLYVNAAASYHADE